VYEEQKNIYLRTTKKVVIVNHFFILLLKKGSDDVDAVVWDRARS
jgi:hypothetical protein